ncbi:hypothetical protein CZ674_11405 [Agrococcus casei LMG 22410]|uniref:Uncharacterized protein n=1 Tax=Agrococcus casei LMG 22410 TaxID=1255656 RepID=A0A1R4GEX2_9MICO|nr:hypothetical protein CZ674_11405 [Agrococcus casei LMG 22410]
MLLGCVGHTRLLRSGESHLPDRFGIMSASTLQSPVTEHHHLPTGRGTMDAWLT